MKALILSCKLTITTLLICTIGMAASAPQDEHQEDPDPFINEIHPNTGYNVTLEYYDTSGGFHRYRPVPQTPIASQNICMVKPSACQRNAN